MVIFVKKYLILIFFVFNIILTKDLAFHFGESYFASEDYEAAITEYKRFIFFNPQSESVNYAYYKIGIAYRNQGKWQESIEALKYSIQNAPNDSIKNEREIALAVVLMASGNYSDAEFQLLKIETFSKFLSLRYKATFFRGIACVYSHKWEEAKIAFQTFFKEYSLFKHSLNIRNIDSLLLSTQNLKYKSPQLAKILSTILPGSGQFYVGDIRNGLNSLLINILTGYLLISSLINKDINNVYLGYSLFQRYYFGNRFHAERIAEDYNNRLNEKWSKNILKALQNEKDK